MDAGCAEVADAFHPRIPRFAQDEFRGDRIGMTAGIQARPGKNTEIRLDGLYDNYPSRDDQRRLFPLIRGNEGTMDLSNYVLQPQPPRFGTGNSSIIAGDLNNTWIRSEHQRLDALARFYQITLGVD